MIVFETRKNDILITMLTDDMGMIPNTFMRSFEYSIALAASDRRNIDRSAGYIFRTFCCFHHNLPLALAGVDIFRLNERRNF